MIRLFRAGRHAHRMPVSYPALAPLFRQDIIWVGTPAEADLYLFAHVMDIEHTPRAVIEDWRRRHRPVVLLCEEPFWDTIWGRSPLARHIHVDTSFGAVPVVQINHQTSDVFRFERIPYYLLTNPRFARTYRRLLVRNAARRTADWQRDWAARAVQVAFMFERRPEKLHDVTWPQADLIGLCAWRTEIAEAVWTGPVERLGRSWQGGPSRFDLKNWHADKLQRLDGRARMLSAFENTHQPDYITEKLFDAFALGSVPLYAASPGHRVHELALPPESWINLHGLTPDQAAEQITAQGFGAQTAEAFQAAQIRLAAWASLDALWERECTALRGRVLAALLEVLDSHAS